jgi:hypothetical protein
MKKTITKVNNRTWMALLLVISCSSFLSMRGLHAQVLTTYSFSGTSGTYTPISGGVSLGASGNDDHYYVDPLAALGVITATPTGPGFDIGFNFELNGVIYDRVGICTNGWVSLGQSTLTPSIDMGNALAANYYFPVLSTGFAAQPAVLKNRISAFNSDLEMIAASGMRIETIGTAPSRTCVIQWTGLRKYTAGTSVDNFNFQIRLNETTNTVEFVYGSITADPPDNPTGVGLRINNEFMGRTTTTSWASSTASVVNTNIMTLTDVIIPGSGLTYTFTELPKAYASSDVSTVSTTSIMPGTTGVQMVKLNIIVTGIAGSIDLTSMDIGTAGSTALADISAINVYSTGSTNTFSTVTPFGSTVFSAAATNPITGTLSLLPGNNYFWITYDVSGAATPTDIIDAEISSVTVGGTPYTPTNAAPGGSRTIELPMTYLSSTATQNVISPVTVGTPNNQVIGIEVVTSTGTPINLSQFNFNANGTTDTSNIRNLKVWYTGNSSSFAATAQFGSTVAMLPGISGVDFTVTGTQALTSGTNYFWLTYDIASGSTISNLIDAELTALTVDGNIQSPMVIAPAGSRQIRPAYCTAGATNTGDTDIGRIQLIDNTSVVIFSNGSATPTTLNPLANGTYTNYTAVTPAVLTSGLPYSIRMDQITSGGTFYDAGVNVFIDFNDDGDFADAGENVYTSTTLTNLATPFKIGTFTVPCSAVLGNVRMRVLLQENVNTTPACGSYAWGETEDYTVTIGPNPAAFNFIGVDQQSGVVAPGTASREVLRIPVKMDGCGAATATEFKFKTTGTTNVADIVSAKLYRTGISSVFNTSTLVGTVPSPSGVFSFSVVDPLVSGDTTNYWLAYEMAPGATLSNVVDAVLDSVQIMGVYRLPANGNPTGNITINAPMTYVSSTTVQALTVSVEQGTVNNRIIGIEIVSSPTGAPSLLTQLDFNANGTTDTANIRNIKVFYTGNSSSFASTTQFGTTLANLPGVSALDFSVTGSVPLSNNTNYFWLTYDIASGSAVANAVDAECTSITFAGSPQVPTVTAPAGARAIRNPYCTVSAGGTPFTSNVTFNTLSNTTTPVTTPYYTIFPQNGSTTTTVLKGASYNLSVTTDANAITSVWIDFNDDGTLSPSEWKQVSLTSTAGVATTIPIVIPCSAVTGDVRMRIRSRAFGNPNGAGDACLVGGSGEYEDYIITLANNPGVYTSSEAVQQSGIVSPGTTSLPVLRIPVDISGCTALNATQFDLSTTGTTTVADITNAKIYFTGNSKTFSATTLFGSVASPSGAFTISGTQALSGSPGDTNNFWLVYDIALGATLGNTIDAQISTVTVAGVPQIPVVTNPAGNYTVSAPMTYVSSRATQADLTKVGKGTANKAIIGLEIVTSSAGAPFTLSQLDFNTNGSTDTANIRNIAVWSTGNSKTFATTTQFGSTLAFLPGATSFSVTDNKLLMNDTNYFWLTYDIEASSTVGNVVDAEATGIIVAGVAQVPSVTAPTGTRQIRNEFCIPAYTNATLACGNSWYINSVNTINAIGNISNSSTGCASTANNYIYYPNKTLTVAKSGTFTLSIQDLFGSSRYLIYIDYNQDGIFDVPSEQVFVSAYTQSMTTNITIPCTALPGNTRMRIRSDIGFGIDPCSDLFYGETEDYNVEIIDNPVAYNYSTAVQQTGTYIPGTNDLKVLRIPVRANGCGVITATNLYFNTAGSTNAADITAAKLYVTGNSATFNTSKLIGSVATPSGSFAYTVTDTLVNNDTTNYWLTYDVSAGSGLGDAIDAVLDSITIGGIGRIPASGNPAGSAFVDAPVSFVSAATTQTVVTKITQGTSNTRVLGIEVLASPTGSPVNVTSLDIATTGTTALSDITNLKVWYTGNSSAFAATTQFGSTVATPAATNTVAGTASVTNGINYFWVTYDIAAAAVVTNVVDAECTSLTFDGTPQTPAITAPTGSREIMAAFCQPSYPNGCGTDQITRVVLGTLDNNTGCTGPSTFYSNVAIPVLQRGGVYKISVTYGSHTIQYGRAWVDFNNDGDFADANESIGEQVPANAGGNGTSVITFAVPLNATLGELRLRIRGGDDSPIGSGQYCFASNSGYGEGEDYTIMIDLAPTPTSYVWNQAAPADYTTASNWTPARTNINLNDIITFNGGGSITSNNVSAFAVSTINVDNITTVTLSGAAISLNAMDALNLTSGKIITSGIDLVLGTDGITTGTLSGTGTIEGSFSRWIAAATGTYSFPLTVGSNSRAASVNYSAAPTVAGKLMVRFIAGAPGATGLPIVDAGINLVNIADAGIWRTTSDGVLTGGTYDVTVNADGIPGALNYTQTALLSRANSASPWLAAGTHVTTTGSNAAMVMSRTGLTAYGEMGIAGDASNPLPVTLTTFTGIAKAGDALLSWTTASEINNKGFDVERSVDGRSFEFAGFVKGAGNSTTKLSYNLTDAKAFAKANSNVLYYRLKQADMNGKFTYSNVVRIQNTEKAGAVSVYPNPFNAAYTVSINAAAAGTATMKMVDLQGKVVSEQTAALVKGLNAISFDDLNVMAGVYFVKVTVDGETQVLKLVKN